MIIALGADIGGSHISCAACDLSEKKYFAETHTEHELDNQGTADEIVATWAATLLETMGKIKSRPVTGIGFAMPGPFDYIRGVGLFEGNNKKYESLYGVDVSIALQKEMNLPEDTPIRFINDATAFALGEDWFGKAKGFRKSLAITLGTGFGSAFLSDHLPVVTGDQVPEMGCLWYLPFKEGSADDYFSTRGLLNRYRDKTGITLSGVKELAENASGDRLIRDLFDDFGTSLGTFLMPWIQSAGTEILVIGGNISNAYHLFGGSLKNYLTSHGIHAEIAVSELKETPSIIGSALLADNDYYIKLLPALKHM